MGSGKGLRGAVLFVFATVCGCEEVAQEQNGNDIEELKAVWKSQRSEIATAHITYRLFQWGATGLRPLGPDQVRTILTSQDLAAKPDDLGILVNKLLEQRHPSPTPWSVFDFYYEGTKSKDEMRGSLNEVQLLTDKEKVEYSPVNNQAAIFAAGGSRKHMRSMEEFRVVPNPEETYVIEERKANTWVLRTDSVRLVVDASTGLIHEADYNVNGKIIKQDIQASFLSYPGGIVFPFLSARVTYGSNGVVYSISLSWVEEAEFNKELPTDAFSLPIPEKTNVFDRRNPSHERTFPQTGPSADVVKMADSARQSEVDHPGHSSWWIVGNIVLLVLLIAVILGRKLRFRQS